MIGSLPSIVSFDDNDIFIGHEAQIRRYTYEENTIFDVKSALGQKFDSAFIAQEKKFWPFQISPGPDGYVQYDIIENGKTVHKSPEMICGLIMQHLMNRMNKCQGETISKAVITVPLHFSQELKERIRQAANLAGIEVISFLNEPTTTAIACEISNDHPKTVLIFDFGGVSLDITILEITENGGYIVKAYKRNSHLGGRDINANIVKWILDQLKQDGIDCSNDRKLLDFIRLIAEEAKITLSSEQLYKFRLEVNGTLKEYILRRGCFRKINMEIFDQIDEQITEALKEAKMEPNQIHKIIICGGSSKIPAVKDRVCDYFDPEEIIDAYFASNECFAIGAARYASYLLKNADLGENYETK